MRDGFIDRYTGTRLVFPAVLRLLSLLLPADLPFHPNWKMSKCHPMYWELFPTIDHVVPVAIGGSDDESNWVTTSMLKNSAKSNWTLEELGWDLLLPGRIEEWDGLMGWYIAYIEQNPELRENSYLRTWFDAASRVMDEVYAP